VQKELASAVEACKRRELRNVLLVVTRRRRGNVDEHEPGQSLQRDARVAPVDLEAVQASRALVALSSHGDAM
jgi:hypothetical protein